MNVSSGFHGTPPAADRIGPVAAAHLTFELLEPDQLICHETVEHHVVSLSVINNQKFFYCNSIS